jgi:uncharacterized protein
VSAAARIASRRFRIAGLSLAAAAVVGAIVVAGFGDGPSVAGSTGSGHLAHWFAIWLVIFVSAAVSSIAGFAFSAIAGAMLFHVLPAGAEAVRVMMVASIGIQIYTVAVIRRSIRWSRCVPFIVGGALALPIGIFLLLALPAKGYLLAIGAGLIAYGVYMQVRSTPRFVAGEHRLMDIAVGAAGGITGPLAAFPGACLVIWCGMRGWDKLAQRAIYQPYILVMQLTGLALLCIDEPGTLRPELLGYVLPGLAGAVIGMRVFRSLTEVHFQRVINAALIASGTALLLK